MEATTFTVEVNGHTFERVVSSVEMNLDGTSTVYFANGDNITVDDDLAKDLYTTA